MAIDLTGLTFNRLTVLYKTKQKNKDGKYLWQCRCECGNEKLVTPYQVRNGQIQSCGCLKLERISKLNNKGKMKDKYPALYQCWQNVKKRCNNPKADNYKYYGGRGITYDSKWEKFEGFLEDMLDGWEEGLTIERLDVNSNYCKDNCTWATKLEQAYNRRNARIIEINGEKKHLSEWSKEYGIAESTIWCRYDRGLRDEKLLYGE
jgi:hypothetical protein